MQKLVWINSKGTEINLTSGDYGITEWEGFSACDVEVQTQNVPFQDGSVFLDALLNNRELSVTLAINDGGDLEKRYRLRRELISALNPKLGEGYLIYTNDFISKRIKCLAQMPVFPTHNSDKAGTPKASLSWTACDPYWEDLEDTEVDINNYKKVNIENDGDVETSIKLDIHNLKNNDILLKINEKQITIKKGIYQINTATGSKTVEKLEKTKSIFFSNINGYNDAYYFQYDGEDYILALGDEIAVFSFEDELYTPIKTWQIPVKSAGAYGNDIYFITEDKIYILNCLSAISTDNYTPVLIYTSEGYTPKGIYVTSNGHIYMFETYGESSIQIKKYENNEWGLIANKSISGIYSCTHLFISELHSAQIMFFYKKTYNDRVTKCFYFTNNSITELTLTVKNEIGYIYTKNSFTISKIIELNAEKFLLVGDPYLYEFEIPPSLIQIDTDMGVTYSSELLEVNDLQYLMPQNLNRSIIEFDTYLSYANLLNYNLNIPTNGKWLIVKDNIIAIGGGDKSVNTFSYVKMTKSFDLLSARGGYCQNPYFIYGERSIYYENSNSVILSKDGKVFNTFSTDTPDGEFLTFYYLKLVLCDDKYFYIVKGDSATNLTRLAWYKSVDGNNWNRIEYTQAGIGYSIFDLNVFNLGKMGVAFSYARSQSNGYNLYMGVILTSGKTFGITSRDSFDFTIQIDDKRKLCYITGSGETDIFDKNFILKERIFNNHIQRYNRVYNPNAQHYFFIDSATEKVYTYAKNGTPYEIGLLPHEYYSSFYYDINIDKYYYVSIDNNVYELELTTTSVGSSKLIGNIGKSVITQWKNIIQLNKEGDVEIWGTHPLRIIKVFENGIQNISDMNLKLNKGSNTVEIINGVGLLSYRQKYIGV